MLVMGQPHERPRREDPGLAVFGRVEREVGRPCGARSGEADDRRDIVGFLERLAFFVVTLWLLFGVVLGVGAVTTGEMAPASVR
ncbi:MAG: hypothetical protein ACLTYW_08870 [Collinsella sp.]